MELFDKPLILPANSSALRLIMYIRDEAHRFAVRFHRRRRGKRMRESILDEIPGLGKKRKQLLLSRFKSVTAMAETSQEELEKLDGIGPQLAKLVKAHLLQK